MNLLDLPKLKSNHWRNGALAVLATVAPGSLIVLLFRPDLFAGSDFGKVVLLSLGITLPVVVFSVYPAVEALAFAFGWLRLRLSVMHRRQ